MWMDLKEKAVCAGGNCSFRQDGGHLTLACARISEAARLLSAVGGIKNHGAVELLHTLNGCHIIDQPIVAEKRAPLGNHNFFVLAGTDLFHGILHLGWGQKLALLYIYGPAGAGAGTKQIRLSAQKSRHLQAIDNFGYHRGLGWFVHVGYDRHTGLAADFGKNLETLFKTRASKAGYAGAIGLVKAGLENYAYSGAPANIEKSLCDIQTTVAVLNDAGASDYEHRAGQADFDYVLDGG